MKKYLFLSIAFLFFLSPVLLAQSSEPANLRHLDFIAGAKGDVFEISRRFITNVGQYGDTFPNHPELGRILFGYEGLDMPVLFTEKGIIHLHRKMKGPTPEEREQEERKRRKKQNELEFEMQRMVDKAIVMEWVNTSPHPTVITEDPAEGYHTYGSVKIHAYAFRRITYQNLYPNIDLVFSFPEYGKPGFEYSLVVRPGGNINNLKMRFSGDVTRIRQDNSGNLLVRSGINTVIETRPVAFYAESAFNPGHIADSIQTDFSITGNEVSFHLPDDYDHNRTLIVDPFVSNTSNLTGVNNGIAKDVDFDYAGNVYVTGGGNGSIYKLAKFDPAGVLQWTFSGSLTIPSWNFGTYYGGWVVEKTTGNIYLGQGFAPPGGHRIIRVNTVGIYDNYITGANANFLENWKMYWRCNNGVPQILVAGGGTNSNNNFALCAPPSTTISPLNVTGIPYNGGGWAQDISDLVIDPVTNSLYTIYGSLYGTPSLSNRIYKNNAPYSGASVAWNVPSGYTAIQEIANRPYLATTQIDNSSNVLALNGSYLFYWDGKNLKAFDKVTGAGVGTPLTITSNVQLMSGGIIADECNNIFTGSVNGTIKAYRFNGAQFDDAAVPDIQVPGFGSSAVYDLAYNDAQKILYASGNGFAGSFDVSSYGCSFNTYSLVVNSACASLTANASISPAPPAGSTVTYILMNGATQVTSNTTGVFSGLSPNVSYTINATVNMICSGVVTSTNFILPGATITPTTVNPTCGNSNGAITITASGGTAPYSYNLNGGAYQPGNSFTGLSSGIYTVGVKDVNGCNSTANVNISNTDGPASSYSKTDATCGSNTGTITATGSGGVPPLTYSINGTTFQSSNIFSGILPGTYTLTVKDASGCTNLASVTINSSPSISLTAIPTTTYCNTSNGVITAIATGGTAPLQYSLNANTYQTSNIFNGLAGGTYTVTVKDANGCLGTFNTTVANALAPTVTATSTTAICNNANGSLVANGTGGTSPYQYSINGTTWQTSPIFNGLTAGAYIVRIKDANNCINNSITVNVNSTNGPQVTATSVSSSCGSSTGSITAAGSGGTGSLQYSINGTTFQTATLFSGLPAGTYNVFVRDANGCNGATIVAVANTAAPTINATVTPTACSSSNGIITAIGAGGTAPLQYSINGTSFQAGNTFNGLATGSYTVTVRDVNGCTSSTSATMTNVANLSITASTISSSCSANTGSITAVGIGGVAPLTYSINGSNYQGSNQFGGLAGGSYTVYVKDANGCISQTTATVNTVLAAQISATYTDPTCTGNNGTINVYASGGVAPLQYSIDGVNYQSSDLFVNIGPGTYTVYVKDAANCIQTTTVTLNNVGAGPGISTFTVTPKGAYPCNSNLGKIVNPKVNGVTCSNCTFSLNFGAFIPNATPLFTNLSPGTYYVTASDANGCSKTITTTINLATLSTVSTTVTGTACNTSNGSIALTGIGTNTPFHTSISGVGGPWVTFDPSYTYTGLAPGIYQIISADDESFDIGPPIIPGGCLDTVTVIVPAIGGPSLVTSKSNGTCLLNDGTITATGSGGTPPLSYSLDGGAYQSSGVFTGLGSGVYVVDVIDDNGCMNSRIETIVNPDGPEITATASAATCLLPNGTVTASATGGTAPYLYSVNGTVFQNNGIFTGLAAGNYTVTVGDASLCYTTTIVTIVNTSRPTVTTFAVAASCNASNGVLTAVGANGTPPYKYSTNGSAFQSSNVFTGLPAGYYTTTIEDANGCQNITGSQIANLTAPTVTLASTAATCLSSNGTITATGTGGVAPLQYSSNGINFQSSNLFNGLAAGTYAITIKDANGCQSSKSVMIASPNVPQTLTGTVVNASCGNSNGSITAAASGGTGTLQYSINGTVWQASGTFNLLPAGTYSLTVKDGNGCTKTLSVTVANLSGPTVSAVSTISSCFANDGTITASTLGGSGAIAYSRNGTVFQSSRVFTGLAPGNYTITARDSRNCINTTNVTVSQVASPVISGHDSGSVCGANIVLNGAGGVVPYQYNINGGPYQTSNIFTCLTTGTYTMILLDANGCRDTLTLTATSTLPVELLYFTAVKNEDYVDLKWVTASEDNCDRFIVERSKDALNFEPVQTLAAAGNSHVNIIYRTRDYHPYEGDSYYRLKQIDLNGTFEYSKIIQVNFSRENQIMLYPNPAINELNIAARDKINHLILYDVTGRIVLEKCCLEHEFTSIDITDLAPGLYSVKLIKENGRFIIDSFIK